MRQSYWMIAVKFEIRLPEFAKALVGMISDPVMREEALHPMHWEVHQHDSRAMAEAELGTLREMVQSECTCGTCPILRQVHLVHIEEEEVEIGLPKPAGEPPSWWPEMMK